MLLLLTLFACEETSEIESLQCSLELKELTPAPLIAESTAVARLSPVTETWDSLVHLNGQPVPVVQTERAGCQECDECRIEYGCTVCQDCDSCDRLCADTCEETITFTVPALTLGMHQLQFTNAYGQTPVIDVEVDHLALDTASDTGE
jgi:hypothetical protein